MYIAAAGEGQLLGFQVEKDGGIPNLCFLNSWEYKQHSLGISTDLI